jgi:DNA-binding beta-propeller fold protein YncE
MNFMILRRAVLRTLTVLLAGMTSALAANGTSAQFKVVNKVPLEGASRWDYLYVDSQARRVYMARATHFSVLDADSGAVVGDIPDTPGAHGVALAPDLGVGFTSDGGENKVTVFDIKTYKALGKIETGGNPDSILFHAATGYLFVQNGKSKSSSVIDAAKREVVATIQLPGRPEFAVADDAGHIFINIEDTGSMVVLDAANKKIKSTWPIKGCEDPSGLAIDTQGHKLFAACSNKVMAVVDSQNGKVLQTVPIGEGCDATAFDPGTGTAFASNNDGTLTIVRAGSNGSYSAVQTLSLGDGSKTMGLDLSTHKLYVPAAKFTGPPSARPRPTVVPGSTVVFVVGE